MPRRSPWLLRYAVALATTGLALLLTLVLGPVTAPSAFLTAYGAVLLAAAFGGFGPGMLATFLSAVAHTYLFLPLPGPSESEALVPLRVGLFVALACTLSWITAALRSARRRMRDAEERYRSLLDGIKDYAIFMLDPDGCVVSWNAGAERLYQYRADEIIGRHWSCLHVGTGAEDSSNAELAQVRQHGRFEDESERRRKDGTRFWAHVALAPLYDESGTLIGFSKITRDVTERTQAEQALLRAQRELETRVTERTAELSQANTVLRQEVGERLRAEAALTQERNFATAVLETVGALVGVTDRDGRIVRINRTCEQALGYTAAEVIGRHFWELLPIPAEVDPAKAVFHKLLAGAWPREYETYWFTRSGERRWLSWSTTFLRNADGDVEYVIGAGIDITEAKRAEEDRRTSEERFRRLVDSDIIGIIIADLYGNITEANEAFLKTVGYTRADLLEGRVRWTDLTPPEWRHLDDVAIEQLRAAGTCPPWEKEYLHRDGSRVPVVVGVTMLDQSLATCICFALDISARKRVEEDLRRSDERFRRLAESDIIGIIIGDLRGNITEANEAFLRMVGYTRADLLEGRVRWADLTPPEWLYLSDMAAERLRVSGTCPPLEKEYIRRDGSRVPVLIGLTMLDPARETTLCFVLDISARKRAEEDLRQSEERFRLAVAGANDGIWDWNLVENKLYFSPRLKAILGHEGVEVEPEPGQWMRRIHPDDRAAVARAMSALIFKRVHFESEHRLQHRDGSYRWVLLRGFPVYDEHGKPCRLAGSLTDITARKLVEEGLRESEERYRELVENVNDAIFMLDERGVVTYMSPVIEQITGYHPSEVVGHEFRDFIFAEDLPAAAASFQRTLSGELEPLEYRVVTKGGAIRWVRSSSRRVRDARFVGMRGVLTDVTERRRAEELLRESEERYRELVEDVNDVIYMTDETGRCTYVNRVIERVSGYSVSEILDQPFEHFVFPGDLPAVAESFSRILAGHTEVQDYRVVTKSGEIRWVRSSSRPVYAGNRFVGVRGVNIDITDRKRAEVLLRENEARFRTLAETVAAATFIFQGTVLRYVNPAAESITEYRRDELLAMSFWDVIHPEFLQLVRQRGLARQRGEELPSRYEVKIRTKSGAERWVEFTGGVIEFDGQPAVLGTAFDITMRKHAEEALAKSEKRFRALIEHSSDIIALLRADGTFSYFGPSVRSILGYDPDELIAINSFDLIHPNDRQAAQARFADILGAPEKSAIAVFRFLHKDGGWRWIEAIGTNLLNEPGIQAVIVNSRDVTDRVQAEAELRKSEERFALAVAGANDGLWDLDIDSHEFYTSPRMVEILGLDARSAPAQLSGWLHFIHPDDRARVVAGWRAHLEGREPFCQIEHRAQHADGTYRWVLQRGMSVRDARGRAYRVVGSLSDINSRKRAEEDLRESEERFRKIFEEAPLGMAIVTLDDRFVGANSVLCRFLGYSREELSGRRLADVTHPDDVDAFAAGPLGDEAVPYYQREKRYIRRDGDTVWGNITRALIGDDTGTLRYRIVMIEDISDRKRAEDEARQRQTELAHVLRVATMNEMAAGLAHEINQPLAAIVGYAKGCARRLQHTQGVAADLLATQEEIAAEALRAGEVIRRLRRFVRKEPPQREWVDLNELVREVVGLVQADARTHGIAVQLDTAAGLPPVHVDRIQIEQVILNLVRNGFEAMIGTGRRELVIRTMMTPDESLEVAICDSGAGLSQGIAERLFTPFFTTKPQGLGMGLSISRLIVESHGGRLWVTPGAEQGTTFRFKLPGHCIGVSNGD